MPPANSVHRVASCFSSEENQLSICVNMAQVYRCDSGAALNVPGKCLKFYLRINLAMGVPCHDEDDFCLFYALTAAFFGG
jgi:hypothetical protein